MEVMIEFRVHCLIGPMFEGLGLGFGFWGGSWRWGNCCALGWEKISWSKEQDFDVLSSMLLDHGMILVNGWECYTKRVWSSLFGRFHQSLLL